MQFNYINSFFKIVFFFVKKNCIIIFSKNNQGKKAKNEQSD